MTSFTSSDQSEARSGRSAGPRRRFPAISGVHLLILATGVLAFVANLAVLRGGEAPLSQMAVSRVDLAPGRPLQPQDVRLTPVDVEESVASGLISDSELDRYQGWVVTGRAAAGSLLSKANLRAPLSGSAFRAMSFPIEIEHAVGGDLVGGDLVDVIRVDDEQASYVATGVKVLDVPGQVQGGLGLSGDFYLVLEVDDRTALILALALSHGEVEVVRSTGSAPVTVRSLEEARVESGDPGASPARWEERPAPGSGVSGEPAPDMGGVLP